MPTNEEKIEPIAAKLPAEPGWRAIQFEVVGQETTDDDREVAFQILIIPIAEWAVDAPKIEAAPPDRLAMMQFRRMFDRPIASSFALSPIDPRTGQRMKNIHRLIPPSTLTDEELIKQTQLWAAEVNEINSKPPEVKPAVPPASWNAVVAKLPKKE